MKYGEDLDLRVSLFCVFWGSCVWEFKVRDISGLSRNLALGRLTFTFIVLGL